MAVISSSTASYRNTPREARLPLSACLPGLSGVHPQPTPLVFRAVFWEVPPPAFAAVEDTRSHTQSGPRTGIPNRSTAGAEVLDADRGGVEVVVLSLPDRCGRGTCRVVRGPRPPFPPCTVWSFPAFLAVAPRPPEAAATRARGGVGLLVGVSGFAAGALPSVPPDCPGGPPSPPPSVRRRRRVSCPCSGSDCGAVPPDVCPRPSDTGLRPMGRRGSRPGASEWEGGAAAAAGAQSPILVGGGGRRYVGLSLLRLTRSSGNGGADGRHLKEERSHVRMAVLGRQHQRCAAIVLGTLYVGSVL